MINAPQPSAIRRWLCRGFAEWHQRGRPPPNATPVVVDDDAGMSTAGCETVARLRARGVALERITLGWNVIGVVVLAFAALSASSTALVGFGLDSLIEIGASTVVLWELAGTDESRQRRALRLIGGAFTALALYLVVQSTVALATRHHANDSPLGIGWIAITAAVMFALAYDKSRIGRALGNPVLIAEGRVTLIDGILATAVLIGVSLDTTAGWWWADPVAGFVIVYYALREAHHIFTTNKVG